MRISRSVFRRSLSTDPRRVVAIATVLLLVAGATAWTITTWDAGPAALAARAADASQDKLSGDRREGLAETATAPRIELSTHRLDLGDGKPNETLRGQFVLSNAGAAPLTFTAVKHCGCAELAPRSGTIAPGGRRALKVGVELPGHANSEKNTSIDVHSDDPNHPIVSCVLSARCPAPFAVAPSHVEFGAVSREKVDDSNCEIRIKSVRGQPPVSVEKLQAEHAREVFHVASSAEDDGAVLLRVTLAPELPFGDHYDTLDLRLAGSDYVMRVPLHVQVAEPVYVVPRTVFFHKDPVTFRFRPVTVLVISRLPGGALARVQLLDGPAGLIVEDQGAAGTSRRRIRLTVEGDVAPGESVVRLAADGVKNKLFLKLVVEP